MFYRRVRAAGRAHAAVLIEASPIIQRAPCRLLFICRPEFLDIHPADSGYRALADAMWEASGTCSTMSQYSHAATFPKFPASLGTPDIVLTTYQSPVIALVLLA